MGAIQKPNLRGIDFIKNPAVLAAQIDMLYGLRNLNVQLVTGQASQQLAVGVSQISGSPPNLVLPLPFKLSAPIADSSATAASVSAQLNLLLAAMRVRGDLPS